MDLLYFDHAATTPVKKEVLKEMLPYFTENFGNGSSIYSIGRRSKRAIDEARHKVAKAIGAQDKEIYFTSCGSESDNLAIKGIARANTENGKHIITSKIEHPAVLNTCRTLEKDGYDVTYLNVSKDGIVDLQELKDSIREDTILITIMFANNEIGTVQPIEEISKIAKEKNIIFHTDAVQAVGNVKIDVASIGVDALSMSAHKFYGPKGVGVLYVKNGIEFCKIQDGGHQERDKRAGTENVAGIVGTGKAIELSMQNLENYNSKLLKLRNYFISEITNRYPEARINGDLKQRLPGNVNVTFPNVDAEELLLKLDSQGICASAGSACSSGSAEPSHVLTAIGLDKNSVLGTLRFTFGEQNTVDDVRILIENIVKIIG